MCAFVHITAVPRVRDLGSPGVGVTGGCEPPDVGAGNQTQVFYKS